MTYLPEPLMRLELFLYAAYNQKIVKSHSTQLHLSVFSLLINLFFD
jgi:hypothetical protein